MPSCIVRSCNSYWKRKEPGLILHVFPRDRTRIMQWLQQTRQFEENLEEMAQRVYEGKRTGAFRICSKHFSTDCYAMVGNKLSLKNDALPTIFDPSLPTSGSSRPPKTDVQYRKKMRYDCGSSTSMHDVAEAMSVDCEDTSCSVISTSFTCDPTLPSMSCHTSVSDASIDDNLKGMPTDSQHSTPSDKSKSLSFHKIYVRQRISRGTMTRPCHTRFKNKAVGTDLHLQKPCKAGQTNWNKKDQAIQCNLLNVKLGTEFSAPQVHMLQPEDNATEQCVSYELHCMSALKDRTFSLIKNEDSSNLQSIVQNRPATLKSYKPSLPTFDEALDNLNYPKVPIATEEFESLPQSQIWEENAKEEDYVSEKKFIIFESCLDWLLKFVPCLHPNCKAAIVGIKKKLKGSCMCVSTICDSEHEVFVWSSQPIYNKMPVGDILLSSAVLCSGCNFNKISSFFRLFRVQSIEKSTHDSNQKDFLFPVLHHHWLQEQRHVIQSLNDTAICVSSNKQCDSQSHRAKSCTYTFFEHSTKKVIGFHVQKRKPGTSIAALEKQAFKNALDGLLDKNLAIKMVCTDRHISIRKLLRRKYEGITHKFDAWHMAKSIGKKIAAASRRKHCDMLSYWAGPIKNHVWWSARFCNNDSKALKEMWSSVVYHTINIHEWQGASHYRKCRHSTLSLEDQGKQRWLQAGTPAHSALKNVVLNKTWLHDLQQISNVCHMGEIENFHKNTLKYWTKEHRFFIDEAVARTELSALEHNYNVGYVQSVGGEHASYGVAGRTKLHRLQNSKARSDCVFKDKYEPSSQDFIFPILCHVLKAVKGNKAFDWRT